MGVRVRRCWFVLGDGCLAAKTAKVKRFSRPSFGEAFGLAKPQWSTGESEVAQQWKTSDKSNPETSKNPKRFRHEKPLLSTLVLNFVEHLPLSKHCILFQETLHYAHGLFYTKGIKIMLSMGAAQKFCAGYIQIFIVIAIHMYIVHNESLPLGFPDLARLCQFLLTSDEYVFGLNHKDLPSNTI